MGFVRASDKGDSECKSPWLQHLPIVRSIAKSSTSDSARLSAAVIHLHSAKLDFRQIWMKRSAKHTALMRIGARNRKSTKSLKPVLSDSCLV